jgi:hypothetical protein
MALYIIPYRWIERGKQYVLYLPFARREDADRFREQVGIH